uniref:Uncharacterized protein n=1 Tax=Arundo donax TaxID=35708 RepID=A0A0A9GKJ5_ARUDO
MLQLQKITNSNGANKQIDANLNNMKPNKAISACM